jgi:hypothetical protein
MITFNNAIKQCDSLMVGCVCLFWKNDKYFQYLSADVGNKYLLLKYVHLI